MLFTPVQATTTRGHLFIQLEGGGHVGVRIAIINEVD